MLECAEVVPEHAGTYKTPNALALQEFFIERPESDLEKLVAAAEEDLDTPESLARRILTDEHRAYPQALKRLLTCRWEVEGRRIRFTEK